MKNLFIVSCFILFASNVYAGGVTDNNNGSSGDILVHSGVNNGANSVGTWKDSSFLKGKKGDTGNTGANGVDGVDGKDSANGVKGEEFKLKNSYELQIEGRLLDTKKTVTSAYFINDFNNNHQTFGVKFVYKMGQSYTDKKIEELEKRLNKLEK